MVHVPFLEDAVVRALNLTLDQKRMSQVVYAGFGGGAQVGRRVEDIAARLAGSVVRDAG